MTSQKAQIQAILNGIDEVLSKTSPRLPWVMSNDAVQQRQMLEQTRQYLLALQQQQEDAQLLAPGAAPTVGSQAAAPGTSPSESAQQVLDSVLQEMNYWRVNMLQPLRSEIDTLQQQREMLSQEIRRMEGQRHQFGVSQQNQMLTEFLQAAMAQMQASLSAQVTQQVAQMMATQTPSALQTGDRSDPQNLAALDPAERLAHLQKIQGQSDQLLLKLDATLQLIFEALNRNIQTYQDSLEQGLDRMHHLGQQGEAMFAFLVNRFAQQLGREASSVLQGANQGDGMTLPVNAAMANVSEFTVPDFLSQIPEPIPSPATFAPAMPFNLSEEVLDVAELEWEEEPLPESESLKALSQALNQLDLSALPTEIEPSEGPLDLFAGDRPLSASMPSLPALESGEPSHDPNDFDSALDLLNQLSAEMQTDRTTEALNPIAPAEAEMASEPALIATLDALYDDAFYANPADAVVFNREAGSMNATTLEQEWFAGLGDPAADQSTGLMQPESQSESPTTAASQTLVPESIETPSDADLSADFAAPAAATETVEVPDEPIETIRSLMDLLPDQPAEVAVSTPEPPVTPEPASQPNLEILPIVEAKSETFNLALGLLSQPELFDQQAPAFPTDADSNEADPEKKKLAKVEVTPLSNPLGGNGDWTIGNSYMVPAVPVALSALIQDLTETQRPSAAASSALPTQTIDDTTLAKLEAVLAEPPAFNAADPESSQERWFLAIDLGTTGISAVLLNQAQTQLYPIYWQVTDASVDPSASATQKQFRLSTTMTLCPVEPTAAALPTIRLQPQSTDTQLCLSDWKPWLRVGVPHYSPQTSRWEPRLQWSDRQTVPLRTCQEAFQQLLMTLNPDRASFMPQLTCGAVGLDPETFQSLLRCLDGVIVGYPSNWSDTYSFNLREAILQAELVQRPDQIVFMEDAIAALLSALPAADGQSVQLAKHQGQNEHLHGYLHNAPWQGPTLILNAGASVSELVLVNLPAQRSALNPTDFYVRSLLLAGQTIDQDIFCQLLYPALMQMPLETTGAEKTAVPDWELGPIDLQTLQLDTLQLPSPAVPDSTQRLALQQRLMDSAAGQQLLAVARSLKISLQYQPQFVLKYGTQTFLFTRQQLTSQVILPYVQRLNRELNTLLAQTNTTAAAVKQVICTGGTASLGAIARWLRQKLPNATIVQDTYPRPTGSAFSALSCSRVAYGLATVPLHPQVIDRARHQFSDYFLLRSLLQVFPAQPAPIETIMQRLEQQGIDTQACRFRILALLEGHLPPGFVPAEADFAILRPESVQNPDYAAIQLAPLFTKLADRTYATNHHQVKYVEQYLKTLLADIEQQLDRPLSLEVDIVRSNGNSA